MPPAHLREASPIIGISKLGGHAIEVAGEVDRPAEHASQIADFDGVVTLNNADSPNDDLDDILAGDTVANTRKLALYEGMDLRKYY